MRWVVVGGEGFIGSAVCRRLDDAGVDVVGVDAVEGSTAWPTVRADLLVDAVSLPPGRVVLALGRSTPRPLRPWTLVLDNALATARIAPQLQDRAVTLVSTIEIYGAAPGPLTEDTHPELPAELRLVEDWVDRALAAAAAPCPPHRAVGLCRELAERDPSGRWVYALSKLAQELIVRRMVAPERLTVLRLANVAGHGQFRVVGRLVEAMLDDRSCEVTDTVRSFVSIGEVARVTHLATASGTYNVSSGALPLQEVAALAAAELHRDPRIRLIPSPASDSCGVVDAARLRALIGPLEDVREGLRTAVHGFARDPGPMFRPMQRVVVPPRPEHPDLVSDRIAAGLWSGLVRGGPWSAELADALGARLAVENDRRLILTNSGTNALRLAISAVAGEARPGDVAACPAYTFHATVEVLRQLGWTVRFVDVDPSSWTLAPGRVAEALHDPAVRLVVAVDALGNPCDYHALTPICEQAGVPLVADSAAALGSRHAGIPVGTQAHAHAFSMSFAKVVSGGGSGGAVVLAADADPSSRQNWLRSAAITEASAVGALDGVAALDELVARREEVAAVYREALAGGSGFTAQEVRPGDRHSRVHWVARVDQAVGRDLLARALADEGIETKSYYEPLLGLPDISALPVTSQLHEEALALPMSSELSLDEAERVVAATFRALRRLRQAEPPARARRKRLAQEPAPLGTA
jgi:dTDP-4-amino-4,6-dideoxygalactose transaminase/nucleoside-diphosphate-sugar epimerase